MVKSSFQKILLALLVIFLLIPTALVLAQAKGGGTTNDTTGNTTVGATTQGDKISKLQNPLRVNSLAELVKNFVEIFTYVVVLFAVIMLIYVGLMYILARGNKEEITKRSNQLLWIVIGVAIVIGARVIIDIVIGTLEASGTVNQQVIQAAKDANKK